MSWTRRADRAWEEHFREKNQNQIERPTVLEKPGRYYESPLSRIPEKVRISFSDGTTAVYQLTVELPAPKFRDLQNEEVGYRWKEAQ